MAETKVRLQRIQGLNLDDLELELGNLQQKVGHFYGTVENEMSLTNLQVPVNSLVFVKSVKQFYHYDGSTWAPILGGGGPGSGSNYNQITKLGVVAPKTITIQIPDTVDFNRPPVEVLKFIPGEQNQVQTLVEFDNADADDFISDDKVIFDGSMKLKTTYQQTASPVPLGQGTLYTFTIDKSDFKKIEKIEVI